MIQSHLRLTGDVRFRPLFKLRDRYAPGLEQTGFAA